MLRGIPCNLSQCAWERLAAMLAMLVSWLDIHSKVLISTRGARTPIGGARTHLIHCSLGHVTQTIAAQPCIQWLTDKYILAFTRYSHIVCSVIACEVYRRADM